jgi:large subunit ribosomal protein L13e
MARTLSPSVKIGAKERIGRGFSLGELADADLNVGEARSMGVPVDLDRRTAHEDNVERLREWVSKAKNGEFVVKKARRSVKRQRGRAYRGLTSSGKKMRGMRP